MKAIKVWASAIRRDVLALGYAAPDPRVPWYAKAMAACVVAYALSPIDLIPDFVPVLGLLDDVIVVPLGIAFAVRLVPDALMAEFRERASTPMSRRTSYAGAAFIVSVWVAVAAALGYWLWRRMG